MADPLKILTVLNYYHPYVSGVSEYARLVSESLAANGYAVTVLTGRHRKDLLPEETLAGVRIVRAEPWVFLHKGYLSFDFIWKYLSLVRLADVVYLHLPMLESGLFASLVPSGKPMLVTYHCDVTASRSGSLLDKLAVSAVRASCRMCVLRADRVAVSSFDYACESSILRGLDRKVLEIHPPDKAPPVELKRKPLSVAGEPARIGFLGRFAEEKGLDVLLDAVPLILKHLPKTRFLLAGDYATIAGRSMFGSLRERLERLSDSVEVLGKLPEEELFPFYRSLDLFLLPSINSYEAFGMVQVEAMKSGVPVVATDLRGVRIAIQRTGLGLLVPPKDPRALANAVVEYLNRIDRPSADEIASRARDVFRNENVTAAYANVIQQLAGQL